MSNKHILIVHENMNAGGAERQIYNLMVSLSNKGYDVSLLLNNKEGDYYINELTKRNIKINSIKESKKYNTYLLIIKQIWFIRQYIKKNNIDIVITYLPHWNIVLQFAKFFSTRWKHIAGARSCDSNFIGGIKYKFFYYLYLLSDYVVANSYSTKEDILKINKIINKNSIKVIYNYVSIPKQYMNNSYIPILDRRIEVIVPANYGKTKNIFGLIDALKLLGENFKDKIHFSWYGVIKSEENIANFNKAKELINSYKIEALITLYESTPNIYMKMSNSDVIGLFSFSEGFPNALCEGMLMGKPIISTNVSDLELIFNGSHNFLAKSANSFDISNAIERLCGELFIYYDEISKFNKCKAEKLFSKTNIEKFEKLF